MGKLDSTKEMGYGLYPVQIRMLHQYLTLKEAFTSARKLKAATNFPRQKCMVISRLKEAGLTAQHAVVRDKLIDEHTLYHLAFVESNVDRQWDRVIFCDESTFSSANDGVVNLLLHLPIYKKGDRMDCNNY
jgi:hypothetical protein